MRRVERPADLPAALAAGASEAAAAFGDGSVYLEREIRPARHIEVQLLGDADGRVVAIGERDCSLQRRHQKLVEEAPAPGLSADERRHLHEMAVRIATAAGLIAAIPAVIFYNYLSDKIRVFTSDLDDFSHDFLYLVEKNFTLETSPIQIHDLDLT